MKGQIQLYPMKQVISVCRNGEWCMVLNELWITNAGEHLIEQQMVFAMHLLDNSFYIAHVQKLLGHKHIWTTQIYPHVSKKDLGGFDILLDNLMRKEAQK